SVPPPRALARSPWEIDLLGPVPTHERAVSPCPLSCSCLRRPPSPPLSTVPAAAPPRSPPKPPRSRSPRPPPASSPCPPGRPTLALDGLPCCVGGASARRMCFMAYMPSSPTSALAIGDMP